ncbi:MAG TPA: DUF86 domain-containing protein [Methanocorpusculum sp.]|nr:DUF86 domain-containing protein [Methanocorpusculum sp.]
MKKDITVPLRHICERTDLILKISEHISYDEFRHNFLIHDSVIRSLEIIGEAVHKLPRDFVNRHTDIPFREFGRLRNFLIHEYFAVDLKRVWMITQKDVPPFYNQVKELLERYTQ